MDNTPRYEAVVINEEAKTFDEAIEALELRSLPRHPLQKGEARVRVFAASLNFFDLLQLIGKYQTRPIFPFVPGSEGAGEIIEVNPSGSEEAHWKVGDKVIFGMVTRALSEEVTLPIGVLVRQPAHMTAAEASGVLVGFATAYNGLIQRGQLKEGETVLVTGAAGGMGIAAIQLAKMVGAKVIAAASSDEKLAIAKSMGADYTINYSDGNPPLNQQVKDLVGAVDVVYEIVGGPLFLECMRCMAGDGRLLVIGFASGEIPKAPANIPLVKGFSIVGVRAGASMMLNPKIKSEIFESLEKWGADGTLKAPYIHKVFDGTLGGQEVRSAFQLIANRKATGKVVVSFKPTSRL